MAADGKGGFGMAKAAVMAAALAVGVSRAGMMPPQVTRVLAEVTDQYAPLAFDAFERNEIPDWITRFGIRHLLAARLEDERQPDNFAQQQRLMDFVNELKNSPIAVNTADANEQHYEVPARFYELVLGKYAKYSSALYPEGTPVEKASDLLDEAGAAMLSLYAKRAKIDTIDGSFRYAPKPSRLLRLQVNANCIYVGCLFVAQTARHGMRLVSQPPTAFVSSLLRVSTAGAKHWVRAGCLQGISGAVVRGALPECHRARCLQLQFPTRMDYGKSCRAWHHELEDLHRQHREYFSNTLATLLVL
eukprot:COSAG02_NODE_4569_length_5209_cov_18.188258_1_plen_303_part_00